MAKKLTEDNLDPNFKKAWLAALRSGEYVQGNGFLKADDDDGNYEYCCLGVLREVAFGVRADRGAEYLAEKSCGITQDTQNKLSQFNDGVPGVKKRSFRGIATWIERNL